MFWYISTFYILPQLSVGSSRMFHCIRTIGILKINQHVIEVLLFRNSKHSLNLLIRGNSHFLHKSPKLCVDTKVVPIRKNKIQKISKYRQYGTQPYPSYKLWGVAYQLCVIPVLPEYKVMTVHTQIPQSTLILVTRLLSCRWFSLCDFQLWINYRQQTSTRGWRKMFGKHVTVVNTFIGSLDVISGLSLFSWQRTTSL